MVQIIQLLKQGTFSSGSSTDSSKRMFDLPNLVLEALTAPLCDLRFVALELEKYNARHQQAHLSIADQLLDDAQKRALLRVLR